LFRLVFGSHDGRALCADSVEKHEPASDVSIAAVDSLKALDPDGPIIEADIGILFNRRDHARRYMGMVSLAMARTHDLL